MRQVALAYRLNVPLDDYQDARFASGAHEHRIKVSLCVLEPSASA